MKLLTIEEYFNENAFDASNFSNSVKKDTLTENLNAYIEYLAGNLSQAMEYMDYLSNEMIETVYYIEFIKRSDDISFERWREIREDEEELMKIKREKTINEIISN
tara:strand:+ start:17017 stop:17331 length:315 start_codon:yes stop_codon:yes gene_type:complete